MSRIAVEDHPTSPETEQLLSGYIRGNIPSTHVKVQNAERWQATSETHPQDDISSSGPTLENKSAGLSRDARFEEASSDAISAVTPASIIVNSVVENDEPPPYSAIVPPNHVGLPYGLFPFANFHSTDYASPYRVEIPLAPCPPTATGFHLEGVNDQHASFPMSLTANRFFKFGRNSEETLSGNGIVEKIDDRKSRRYGVILVAAAVIISLMALSLMVRFVMKKSWWRG